MWTRAELKERAKECLKKYYWAAFAVSLIFALVGGFGGGSSGSGSGYDQNYNRRVSGNSSGYIGELIDEIDLDLPDPIENVPGIVENVPIGGNAAHIGRLFWGMFTGAMLIMMAVAILLSLFITPVMEVGQNRFYMESRLTRQSAGVGKIFWGFSHNYLNIVLTMFLRGLFITLGTVLCVIPGIYLNYCYYMVPFILSENPEMKPMEAMRLSKEMMEGHKFNTFVLEISFIGWFLLGALACGIGGLFVRPYYVATFAELYAVLRAPYGGGLNGFGYPDVVPTGSFDGRYVNPDNVYDSGNGQYGGYGQSGQYGGYGNNQNGGYGQSGQYGGYGNNQNGGYGQSGQYGGYGNGQYGDGQNQGYNQYGGYRSNGGGYGSGTNMGGGFYDAGNERNESMAEYEQVQRQNAGSKENAAGGPVYHGGYGEGTETGGWNRSGGQNNGNGEPAVSQNERETEVNRSEGGPGRGYYLNGVFYPYTDEDKNS